MTELNKIVQMIRVCSLNNNNINYRYDNVTINNNNNDLILLIPMWPRRP